MTFWERIRSLSLSAQIFIGLTAGIILGLFLGEFITPIGIVADGYILLLQMTVLPYITVSLIAGIGSLNPAQARIVFSRVGLVLLLLWFLSLVLVLLIPLAFPDWKSATFFSTSLIEPRQSFDFLNLYIPSNPFNALANNVVPSVVLFSIVIGIALIRIEKKEQLLAFLNIIEDAIGHVNRFVVRLTPIGLFAIGANLAGTLKIQDLERVQVFLLVYSAMSILLCLYILPALMAALTPVSYIEVLRLTRDALVTAFMTGNLFVVLPILSEASKTVLSNVSKQKDVTGMPDIIVPASFNFPHSGKVLSISFILFAAWFADVSLSFTEHLKLATLGLLSSFGSLTAAVPYLLDFFRIPIDTFQLFLATGLVNSRFGSAAAAMHTFVLSVLGSCAVFGLISMNPKRIIRYCLLATILTAATILGLRFYFAHGIEYHYTKDDLIRNMELTRTQVPFEIQNSFVPNSEYVELSALNRIQKRGKLRVGYLQDSLPYSYFNSQKHLVGLDVDMAQQLAADLHVSLEFVPIDRNRIIDQVNGTGCDVLMSGLAVTTDRARELLLTNSYQDEHLAFVTFDHRRAEFLTRDSIREHSGLRIGIPNVPYYISRLQDYAPGAQAVVLDSISKPLENSLGGLDAIAITAERGSMWSLLYPEYSVVVPQPDIVTIPIAYAVGRNDQELLAFLNTWLDLKKKDGTITKLYDHWILGKNAERTNARWSIIRNVLHWVR